MVFNDIHPSHSASHMIVAWPWVSVKLLIKDVNKVIIIILATQLGGDYV